MEAYFINHWTEEGCCDGCGCPILEGDRAYLTTWGSFVCSKACGVVADERAEKRHDYLMKTDKVYASL